MHDTSLPALRYSRRLTPFLAAGAAALASLGAIGFAMWRPSPPSVFRPTSIKIGPRALELDAQLMRSGPQRAGGALDRADLIIQWPGFGPAALVAHDERGRAVAPDSRFHLLISLRQADGVDPATRALTVHGRFVESEIWSNPGGLIARRFKPGSPYEGDELIMTPEGREFAARCPLQTANNDPPTSRCLALFRVADIDATVSFDPTLLPEWRRLREGVLSLVGRALR